MRSPTRKARRGVAPRHAMTKGQTKRRGRKKRSRINQLGLVAFLAFIFFTPEAKQFVLAKWAEVEEYINDALAGWQTYPLEAEYTVVVASTCGITIQIQAGYRINSFQVML